MVRQIIQTAQTGGSDIETDLLASKTKLVESFDFSLEELINNLLETMGSYPFCVGLAAPQIGDNRRVAVAKISDSEILTMVNPIVTSVSGNKDKKRESCMSLWGLCGTIERRNKVGFRIRQSPERIDLLISRASPQE